MLCALLLYLSNQAQDCCCRCSWCVELVVLVVLVWLVNLVNNMFIYNLTIPLRMDSMRFFRVILRNNEKLPSLSLPLNLNLNYENLLFSSAKVLLFS